MEAMNTEGLQARIQKKLADSPYYAVRQVVCGLSNGVPVLQGRVPSYFLKQMALTAVISVLGESDQIKNGLVVSNEPS